MNNEDSIRFTILNNHNQLVTLTATLGEDGQLYRCGSPIYCNCNNTKSPYLFLDGEVYCPCCGKKSLKVETFTEAIANIHLEYLGTDFNTMQELYKLSDTLPYSTWNRVADLFVKLTPLDVDFGYHISYVGWVTSNPVAVEERLNIREDLWVCNQKEDTTSIISEESVDNTLAFDIVDKLHEVFSIMETPYGRYNINGSIIQNPLFPQNNYGTGECWTISDDEIWYIRNNYRPGDNLNQNNILIDGSLRAIGKVIPYDEDVAALLMELKNLE